MNLTDKSILSKRYADAYLSVVGDYSSELDATVFYNISTWLHCNTQVVSILSYVSDAVFKRCAIQFLLHQGLPESLLQLLVLLRLSKRIMLLGNVLHSIGNALDKLHNVCRANLYSAPLISQEHIRFMDSYLSHLVNHSVYFYVQVDPALIAGIRVVSNDWNWEKSIAKKIRTLQAICLRHVT